MRIARFLLPGIVLAGAAGGEDLPAVERAYIASRIYALVQQNFAHWEAVPDLDWNAAYRAYLDQALSSADRRSFDFATMELVAKLQNSHTSFYDDWLYRQDGAPLGFRLIYLSGKWVVKRSEVAGLAPGDVVVSINKTPVEEYYRERSKYIWGSNEQSKRSRFSALSIWFPVRFQMTLHGGRVIEIDRASLAPSRSQTQEEPASEGQWLAPEKVAYIRIPSFSQSKYEASALDLLKYAQDRREPHHRRPWKWRRQHARRVDPGFDEPALPLLARGHAHATSGFPRAGVSRLDILLAIGDRGSVQDSIRRAAVHPD